MENACLPRKFVIVTSFLLILVFLVGTALAFNPARAAPRTMVATPVASGSPTISPTSTQVTQSPSANMTGIIILGILLVAIIAIGLLWGGSVTHK